MALQDVKNHVKNWRADHWDDGNWKPSRIELEESGESTIVTITWSLMGHGRPHCIMARHGVISSNEKPAFWNWMREIHAGKTRRRA